ncbi:MAG: hypothetical protein ABIJ82_02905 [Patescibacteria group bacterium]|nr:hypothetical protein [Patescibacteria group bacterium]
MKIDILLAELDKLNFPKDQYAITSSGVLAIRGIREANDLDILVTPKLWKELSQKYLERNSESKDIKIGNLHIFWEGSFDEQSSIATVMEQINTADTIKGYRFVNLELAKRFKKVSGREKDKRDLELIKNYEMAKNHPSEII